MQSPPRIAALLASCSFLSIQLWAEIDLWNRQRAAHTLPSTFTDPFLYDKLGRVLLINGLHLAGTALLVLLLLALWLPRWPDENKRALFRAALPALCPPLCSALAWMLWAGIDLRFVGDSGPIAVVGALAGIFLPLLSVILFAQQRWQLAWRIAPLLAVCLLIELWSLGFAASALVMGLGA